MNSTGEVLNGNSYPGRGIVAGTTPSGKAVFAYFIMGRSANSKNRVFVKSEDGITIYPFDETKVEDPSLIIYSPVRRIGSTLIVTNGDQTDTIYEFLERGGSFEGALETRTFEPDAPNFTPRISAVIDGNGFKMSILKSLNASGTAAGRFTYAFEKEPGVGRFIHTYVGDGKPLPSFSGEPELVFIPDDLDEFTRDIWENLDPDNKISLYTGLMDFVTGKEENRLINKYNK